MTYWTFLVDCLVIAFLGFSVWRGYKGGLLPAVVNLLGLVTSFAIAYWLYIPLADRIAGFWSLPISLLHIFSFLLLAFGIDTLLTGAIFLLSKKWADGMTWLFKPNWLGSPFGLVNGLITITYLVSIFSALPIEHPLKTTVTTSLAARPLLMLHQAVGSPAQQIVTPAINDLSQLFTVQPGSDEMVELHFTSDKAVISVEDEAALLDLVNQERRQHNLPILTPNTELRQVARAHSQDMFLKGYFSHHNLEGQDPFDRLEAAGISYRAAGENLALAPTVAQAHTGLMNSPGHRRNILDGNYRQVGIGAYRDPRYGIMFTQVFSN